MLRQPAGCGIDPHMGGLPIPLGISGDGCRDHRRAEVVAGIVLDNQDRAASALLSTDNRRQIGVLEIAAMVPARFCSYIHVLLPYFM